MKTPIIAGLLSVVLTSAGATELQLEFDRSDADEQLLKCLSQQKINLEESGDMDAVADACNTTRADLNKVLIREVIPEIRNLAYGLLLLTGQSILEISDDGYQDPQLGVVTRTEGTEGGLIISGITPGSAAEGAGLRSRDIILSINGESFADIDDRVARRRLREMIENLGVGAEMDIEFRRSGQVMHTFARIGARTYPPFRFIVGG